MRGAMSGRFGNAPCRVAEGWSIDHLLPPSRLFGANGIRTGADGRIYVAQLSGSRVSAIDPDSGAIEHLATQGSDIIGPDDLVFDEAGNLYITEFTENRVSMRTPSGATRVLQGDIFGANPITYHQGRLIAGECRPDARIMELDRDGGAPRVIIGGLALTNAFDVGPDGKLYFPVMEANQIWRIGLDGGEAEVVAGDLGVPDSVKFDSKGFIISTQVGSGLVLRIDPRSGDRQVLADIGPGLDNSTFVGGRLFISHMTGSIHEILAPGEMRALNEKGLLWPMGVAAAADGSVYVADGSYAYVRPPEGRMALVGMLFTPGYPGFHRGAAADGTGGWIVTTSIGEVKRYRPDLCESELLTDGFDRLMGVAARGERIIFAEGGTGRVHALEGGSTVLLASDLVMPAGVALGDDGTCYVTESGAGRIVALENGRARTVIDGLGLLEGIALHGDRLYAVDVSNRELVSCDTAGGDRRTIVADLPVGAPDGPRKYLGPAGVFSGPMLSFAGLAAGPDGTLYVGADGDGSVMALRPER
jgi:sugar lactone lactonase YvrE